jgi:hypothetical protein
MSLLQMFLGHESNDLCLGGIQFVYSDMELWVFGQLFHFHYLLPLNMAMVCNYMKHNRCAWLVLLVRCSW